MAASPPQITAGQATGQRRPRRATGRAAARSVPSDCGDARSARGRASARGARAARVSEPAIAIFCCEPTAMSRPLCRSLPAATMNSPRDQRGHHGPRGHRWCARTCRRECGSAGETTACEPLMRFAAAGRTRVVDRERHSEEHPDPTSELLAGDRVITWLTTSGLRGPRSDDPGLCPSSVGCLAAAQGANTSSSRMFSCDRSRCPRLCRSSSR